MALKKKGKKKVLTFKTPIGRMSWPHVFEARAFDDDDPKSAKRFDCQMIFTPAKFSEIDKQRWAAIKTQMNKVCQETFGCDWKDLREEVEGAKIGLRSGKKKDKEQGYGEGTMFFTAGSKYAPGICSSERGDDGKFILVNEENDNTDMVYPGAYCRATITVFAFDGKGKGLSFGLRSLQMIGGEKPGERLDSRTDASEDFDEEEEVMSAEDDEFDDDEEAPAKKKKKKPSRDEDDEDDSDDDEDEAPVKKKKKPSRDDDDEDDEEDERPAKKKKKPSRDEDDDGDDEDDDPPAKKKKKPSRDEDDDEESDDEDDE